MKAFALLTVVVSLVLVGCSKSEDPAVPAVPSTNGAPAAPAVPAAPAH